MVAPRDDEAASPEVTRSGYDNRATQHDGHHQYGCCVVPATSSWVKQPLYRGGTSPSSIRAGYSSGRIRPRGSRSRALRILLRRPVARAVVVPQRERRCGGNERQGPIGVRHGRVLGVELPGAALDTGLMPLAADPSHRADNADREEQRDEWSCYPEEEDALIGPHEIAHDRPYRCARMARGPRSGSCRL